MKVSELLEGIAPQGGNYKNGNYYAVHDGKVLSKHPRKSEASSAAAAFRKKNPGAIVRVKHESEVNESWKGGVAALATAASLGAGNADAITLNPARIIDGRGNTAANPYKNPYPQQQEQKVVTVGGREYIRHALPNDRSSVQLAKTDDGKAVYVWIEKSGMRPQYTYYWWAPTTDK